MDFGNSGFTDTKRTLKKNEIEYCYSSTIAYKKVKGIKIAFIGFNQLDGISKQQISSTIKKAKKKKRKNLNKKRNGLRLLNLQHLPPIK